MGSANNSLTEVHMTMGKFQDKNNEEEEPVDTNQICQLWEETLLFLLQCFTSNKYTKHSLMMM